MKISYNPKSSLAAITPLTAANDDIIFDLYASKLWAKGIRIGADWADISSKPSSLKNPYALTISLNGTSQGPYDGSTAKNINITPSSIGAATSGHNHDGRYVYNYGGTQMDANSLNKNALGMSNNSGITGDWWHILQAGWNNEYRWNSLIAFPTQNKKGMYYRSGLDNTAWGDWVKLLDVSNSYVTGGKGYINGTEITLVDNASKLLTARNLWGNSFDGTKDINGSIIFPDIGDTAISNKISWSGSSDGADIYYLTTGQNLGNLVLNVKDDTNEYILLALNGVFKSHFDVANSYWTGRSALADKWTTARTFTIGNTAKNVDGSGNVSWSLAEIGVRDTWRAVQVNSTSIGTNTLNLCGSTYIGLTNVNGKVTFSLVGSGTTANQAILSNGTANGWTLKTLNIANWDTAYNLRHSHTNKSVLDGITSGLVTNWNTAYTFVSTITGEDADKVINKWDEIVNFLAGITEDNKLNTLLNSKLSILLLAAKEILTTKTNNALYWVDTKVNAQSITTGPFTDNPYALLSVTNYNVKNGNSNTFYRSRLAFSSVGDIKVASCHHENEYKLDETWYNVLTSKNSGIDGSTIKLNGTSITVYSSTTADSKYVKKTGDTMSGILTIDTTNFGALTIKRNDDTNGASIQFRGKSSVYGYIGLNNSTKDKQFLRWNSDTSKTYTILDTSSTYVSSGKGVINGTTITQVDNATNSGNADTIDGVHLNGIFTAFLANGNTTRLVIGGVTKDLTIPYASLSSFLCKNSTFNSTGLAGLQYYDGEMSNTTNNNSWSVPSSGWHLILHLPLSVGGYFTELSFPVNDINGLAWRQKRNSNYYGWYRILDSNNYSSYVKKIGTSTVGSSSIPIYLNEGTPTLCSTTLGVSITGNAATATKLTSSAGNATLPIYFSDGKPVACTASLVFSNLSNSGNDISITVVGLNRKLTVGYATNAGSATRVIVNLNTTNDTNYPLIWSNLANTNNVTENQLYKSWLDLYYNPKNKRLFVKGSINTANINATGTVTSAGFKHSGVTENANLYILTADGGYTFFNLISNELAHEFSKDITVTSEWTDIEDFYGGNLNFLTLPGTYIVLVYYNDNSADGMYEGYFSGIMSWFTGTTNSNNADEIVLHRVGHAYANTIYLRTRESLLSETNPYTKLQISANTTLKQHTYKFKFKRIC